MSRLVNPYESGNGQFGALTPTGRTIALQSWEEGARAVIARMRVHAEENELPALNAWASRLELELDAPTGEEYSVEEFLDDIIDAEKGAKGDG